MNTTTNNTKTNRSLFLTPVLTLTLGALWLVGCGASSSTSGDEDRAALDSALNNNRAHQVENSKPTSHCKAGEKVVLNCTRGVSNNIELIAVDGYLLSACLSPKGIKVRFGQIADDGRRFEFPSDPDAFASAIGTGKTQAKDGWKGTFLHLQAPPPSGGDHALLYDMGRTSPSATGEEIGEGWIGFSIGDETFSYDVARFVCFMDDKAMTSFGVARAPNATFDMSSFPTP
jgi:hypothetical protein